MDEEDVSTLGKRTRNNLEDNEENPQETTIDGDESDDDLGPMPAPAEESGITKKKRKGVSRFCIPCLS